MRRQAEGHLIALRARLELDVVEDRSGPGSTKTRAPPSSITWSPGAGSGAISSAERRTPGAADPQSASSGTSGRCSRLSTASTADGARVSMNAPSLGPSCSAYPAAWAANGIERTSRPHKRLAAFFVGSYPARLSYGEVARHGCVDLRTPDDPPTPAPRRRGRRRARGRRLRPLAPVRRPVAVPGVVAGDRRREWHRVRHFHSGPTSGPPRSTRSPRIARPLGGRYLLMGPAAIDGAQAGPMITDTAASRSGFARPMTTPGRRTSRSTPIGASRCLSGGRARSSPATASARRSSSTAPIARSRGSRAANGHHIDLHELTLSDRGTALFTCPPVSSARGPELARRLAQRLGP